MKIPLLGLRKKKEGRKGSPLKSDATLVSLLSKLPIINNDHSFETWKKEFLERLGYFLIDESTEKSEDAYHVRLKVKVEKLARVVAKIAHHVNDGSLGETVTIQARHSLDDGMKSCEDLSTYLKVLSPRNVVEEKIVGFTKYNTAAILVETGFSEYERLNMCRDILQVLREHFVNPVAELEHIDAFDKFDREIISFKTIILDDVGLLPVLKKQRQLKSPEPPQAIIAEIRRGVLRKALIKKSTVLSNRTRQEKDKDPAEEAVKPKKGSKRGSRTTSKSPHGIRSESPTKPRTTSKSPHSIRNQAPTSPRTTSKSTHSIFSPHSSRNESPKKPRTTSKSPHSTRTESHTNRRTTSKSPHSSSRDESPMKRRTTSKSPHSSSKRHVDDSQENSKPMRRKKKSRSPKRKSDSSDPKTPFSSRRRVMGDADQKTPSSRRRKKHADEERNSPKQSGHKRSTTSSRTNRTKSGEEKTPIHPPLTKQEITHHNSKAGGPVIFSKEMFSSKGKLVSEDDKSTDKSLSSSIHRKNRSRQKAKNARKGKSSLKSIARERNRIGQKGLTKKELSVTPLSPDSTGLFESKNDGYKFQSIKEDVAYERDTPISPKDKRFLRRNVRQPKTVDAQKPQDDGAATGSQFNNFVTSNRIDSFELISSVKPTLERSDKKLDGKGTRNKKKKSSRQKKTALKTDDYKKIIHRKTYPAKTELPKLNLTRPFPALVSDNAPSKEESAPTEKKNSVGKHEKSREQSEEITSSAHMTPLLDHSDSHSYSEDESSIFQFTSPNRKKYLFSPQTQRNQTLLGRPGSMPGLTLFNQSNIQKKGVDSYVKSYFKTPSFYDNFVKPLTTNENNLSDNKEGRSPGKGQEQWDSGSVFEDSVCSSRYTSGQSSIDKAIANFNSDQTILELEQAIKMEKKKETKIQKKTDPKSLLSPTRVLTSPGYRKAFARRGEKINIDGENSVFVNQEEYSVRDLNHALTAEEEAARMADEVAKLEIALEDDLPALFSTEEALERSWQLNEELQLSKNMLNLKISEEKLQNRKTDKAITNPDDEKKYQRGTESQMVTKIDNNKGMDVTENIVTPQTSKYGTSGNVDEDNEEEENVNKDLDTSHVRKVSEALDMVEKMLLLETDRDEVILEEEFQSSSGLGDSGSRFDAGGSCSEMNCRIPSKDADEAPGKPKREDVGAINSKHSRSPDAKSKYNPSFLDKPKKTSEYQPFFSLQSNDILSPRPLGKSLKAKGPLSLAPAKQNRNEHRTGLSNRSPVGNKATAAGRSVRVYDPSARLSRWQAPGVIKG